LKKKEGTKTLGENGPLFPTFGNHIEDFVKFYVYDLNGRYIKYGISEDFQNDDSGIKLNPGNDLRKVGFTRGNYKVEYFFYRRLAGADEVVLTKTVGDESGIIHSGNPQLTGIPMGNFYVDDGKVFQGEKPPVDGSPPNELDVKEYKFFIDEVSADRTEVRLAPQSINLDRYKEEFDDLSNEYGTYTPVRNTTNGVQVSGKGNFKGMNNSNFSFDTRAEDDAGLQNKFIGGTLGIKNAYVVGYTENTNTEENSDWSLEDPIPSITIETNYTDNSATTETPVTFTAKRENGNIAPSQLSYYWDFGCGHQEFGGPEISHTYTITGNMNVSVVINSPNFVDTVTLDNSLSISYSTDDPASPATPAPSSPLDGKIIKWDGNTENGTPQKVSGQTATLTSRFFIQSGHRRWITSQYNIDLLRDIRGLEEDADVELYTGLINNIPVGPHIGGDQLTGDPIGLNEPITDGYLLGTYGEEDSGDDDSGDDDSGPELTYYTLNITLKYDTVEGPTYMPQGLPYTLTQGDGEPDHEIDGYITIDDNNVGRSYNESIVEGTAVNIGIVDDSDPSDNYGLAEWLDGHTNIVGERTVVMTQDRNLTAVFGVVM